MFLKDQQCVSDDLDVHFFFSYIKRDLDGMSFETWSLFCPCWDRGC